MAPEVEFCNHVLKFAFFPRIGGVASSYGRHTLACTKDYC
jgi:hypothetical protein